MNRHRFTDASVSKLKQYLKKPEGKKPNVLNKYEGTIKRGRLYLENKEVIPQERVDQYLRKKIYDGRTPMTRDGAFYWLSKHTVGLSRSRIDKFLKKQRIIRETDNQQATTKRPPRRVNTKGRLHVDLVEVKLDQLKKNIELPKFAKKPNEEEKDEQDVKKGYFFGCVDSITSLSFYKWVPFKSYRFVTFCHSSRYHSTSLVKYTGNGSLIANIQAMSTCFAWS